MGSARRTCLPRPFRTGWQVHTRVMGKDAITRATLEIKLSEFYIQVPNSALGNLARCRKIKLVPNMHNDDNSDLKNKSIYFCSLLCLEDAY